MSRAYKLEVYAKGISLDQLSELMTERFGWEEMCLWEYKGVVCFQGEGWLTAGQSEREAHGVIYNALKAVNPSALISSQWTCIEDLPYSTYGDDFDAEMPMPDEPYEPSSGERQGGRPK